MGRLPRLSALALVLLFASVALSAELPRDLTLPDPVTTPGALNPAVTQQTIRTTICVSGWTKTVRPPVSYTNRIKKDLMAKAGIPWAQRATLELDHAYPLALGGSPRDPRNLWVEQWSGQFGAHAKDRLEVALQRRTCHGDMTLDQARALIMPDWITAYKRFFGNIKRH